MAANEGKLELGLEVVVAGGAFAGERGSVVARDGDQITIELSIDGRPTRMAFDASALLVPTRDPRAAFRVELEQHYQRCAREDMIRWFSQRDPEESLEDTDELACLYQIASPIRREYLKIADEFDACFTDRASETGQEALEALWLAQKRVWFERLAVPALDDSARKRALDLMDRVRAAIPASDDEAN